MGTCEPEVKTLTCQCGWGDANFCTRKPDHSSQRVPHYFPRCEVTITLFVAPFTHSAVTAFSFYLADFNTWKTNIMPLLPSGTRLMVPSWACTCHLSNAQSFDSRSEEHTSELQS